MGLAQQFSVNLICSIFWVLEWFAKSIFQFTCSLYSSSIWYSQQTQNVPNVPKIYWKTLKMSNTITHQIRWEIILWIGWKNIPCCAMLTCCSLMDRKPKQLFLSFCHHRHHRHHHHKRPASSSLILLQWIYIVEIYVTSKGNIYLSASQKIIFKTVIVILLMITLVIGIIPRIYSDRWSTL